MFRHRLTKFCVSSFFAMFVLFVGGSLQSCQDWLDVYPYDNPGDPEWLGSSVYDFLKQGTPEHSYTNYVAIIDSLGERETFAHTGSKTLFVADDEAFERFFNNGNNIWGVNSVAEMTKAQMKFILKSSMLDNAMLLDMLSSTGASTSDEGTCLRRNISLSVIDTIPVVDGSSMEYHKSWPTYNKYWDILRGKERTGKMRLAMDGTRAMMVHFLGDYLKNKRITASDIQFLFKKKDGSYSKTFVDGDAFIYSNKIVASGVPTGAYSDDTMTITCKNGYIYRLDSVLLPPSNMADELRRHRDTRIFSHLLDRFCIPVYDKTLSDEFKAVYKSNDSIFRLRYFTSDFKTNSLLASVKSEPLDNEVLRFDPGQNNGEVGDMRAMFVPSDNYLYEYFVDPSCAGHFLLARFAPGANLSVEPRDLDGLLSALDSVPQNLIADFINNLMQPKFTESVLSSFDKVMDDTNELMNIKENHVDECVIANNGVIYILNNVFSPGKYQAVSAPTTVYDNMTVMQRIIELLRYDYYLLAMDANYTFIIPDNDHFIYYDPLSKKTVYGDPAPEPVAYWLHYDKKMPGKNNEQKFWANKYQFNPATYAIEKDLVKNGVEYGDNNALTDLIEHLILVHDDESCIYSGNKYFQTKGYGTIKIEVDPADSSNIRIYGGEQLEMEDTYITVSNVYTQKNGYALLTVPGKESNEEFMYSAIPTPPTRSVFENMQLKAVSEYDKFYEFFKLCYQGPNYATLDKANPGLLQALFNINSTAVMMDSSSRNSIFHSNWSDREFLTTNTVPFFNIYHYTVYVPSNESVRKVYGLGLPTWAEIDSLARIVDYKPKAAAMLRSIINFAKYHFQDNSVYIDNLPITATDPVTGGLVPNKRYTTAVIDELTNRFYELELQSEDKTFTITDDMGNVRRVLVDGEENKDWNIMCRDNIYTTTGTITSATIPSDYQSSAFAVIQPIDDVLLNKSMFSYEGDCFKRFAKNGAAVDTMYVDGNGAVEAADGRRYYLVGKLGNIKIKDNVNNIEDVRKAGYLMVPLAETDSDYNERLTRERLIVKDSKPVLVDNEGFWVEELEKRDVVNGKATTVKLYEYKTIEEEGIIYKVKWSNDGEVRTLEEVGKVAAEDEESGDNN